MDKETAERLSKLETKMDEVQEERRAWNTLLRDTIFKTLTWLLGIGIAGAIYGWHLPSELRKSLADWITK